MAAEKVHAEKMYTDAKKAIGRERGKIKTKRHPKGTEKILRKVAHLQDGVRFSSTSSREIVDFFKWHSQGDKVAYRCSPNCLIRGREKNAGVACAKVIR